MLVTLLLITIGLKAEDDQIQTIFNETRKEIKNITEDKALSPAEKTKKIDLCKKKNFNRLDTLKSFYVTRMMFNDSKAVKEAMTKFETEDFGIPTSDKNKVTETKPTEKPKTEEVKTKPEEEKKSNGSYLERKKEGVTANEFLALPQERKDQYIKKFVSKDPDGFFMVNKGKYTVKTDVSAEYAMEKAIFMDDFYISFERVFCRGFTNSASPTLYITKTRRGYFEVLKKKGINAPSWSGGLYYSSEKLLAGYQEAGDELMKVLLHEGTHQLMDYYTGKDLLPWFNEGIATNFESWDIYKSPRVNVFESQFKSVWLETVATHHQKSKYTLSDFKFLLNLSYEDWNNSVDPSDYYAQGWSMVNFFMNTPENFKVYDRILVGFMKNLRIEKILTEKEIETYGKKWIEDLDNRIVPVYKHGKDQYEAMQVWIKTKSYDSKLMTDHVYQQEQKGNLVAIEFKYLKAIHMMITGKTKEALEALTVIVAQNEDLPNIYSSIAYCQSQNNLKDEMKKNINSALQKDGNDLLARSLQ